MNDLPALTGANGPLGQEAFTYLPSGDRATGNGETYCYEAGTHRLASVGAAHMRYGPEGAMVEEVDADGATLQLCYGARGELSSLVGHGGEVDGLETDFRKHRVGQVWPVNGLREDFRVDDSGRLMEEAGVASLASQWPRPVRDYVWLGQHPAVLVELEETAAGAVTKKGVRYLHSGHLGEVLTETDEDGHVLRHRGTKAFGERAELEGQSVAQAFKMPSANSSSATPVAFPGARATKLHLSGMTMAGCESIVLQDDATSIEVARVEADAGVELWSEWLPSAKVMVTLKVPTGCAADAGFTVSEAQPEWGGTKVQARSETTAHPYPAAGQQFHLSLAAPAYLQLSNVALASCDAVEVRDATGRTMWKRNSTVPAKVWTSRVSGEVDVGIWGQGCNGTEKKAGFSLAAVRSDVPASWPASTGLPGQLPLPGGLIDNWHRQYSTKWGRYLSPELMILKPEEMNDIRAGGWLTMAYSYARNAPLEYVDGDGRHWYDFRRSKRVAFFGSSSSMAFGGACTCSLRIDTKDLSSPLPRFMGGHSSNELCWNRSLTLAGDNADHEPGPASHRYCPFSGVKSCKAYCREVALDAWGSPSGPAGWSSTSCGLGLGLDDARMFLAVEY